MPVSRSDVSCFCSIHRDNCVTGAKAMSASVAGSGVVAALRLRTNKSRVGPASPESAGFQRVAGATSAPSATFRGPVRRSSSGAIDLRQLPAAIWRSPSLIVTCTSFSASAKVDAETSGPAAGAVANVGGAPGVEGAGAVAGDDSLRHAIVAPSMPSGAVIRNWRRVFMDGCLSGSEAASISQRGNGSPYPCGDRPLI
jgi:hypothetical protein